MNASTTPTSKVQTPEQKLGELKFSITMGGVTTALMLATLVALVLDLLQLIITDTKTPMTVALIFVGIGVASITFVKFSTYVIHLVVRHALIEHDLDKASA